MDKLSLAISQVSPLDTKRATALVAEYRKVGNGSNRTDWVRVTALLVAVFTAIRTGKSVEITDLFPAGESGKQYHTAHRALSAGVVRPFWNGVVVQVLRDCDQAGEVVSGETTTTAKGRVFLTPTFHAQVLAKLIAKPKLLLATATK
jgi:hypothetical protein